jgi:hypothetical protein
MFWFRRYIRVLIYEKKRMRMMMVSKQTITQSLQLSIKNTRIRVTKKFDTTGIQCLYRMFRQ